MYLREIGTIKLLKPEEEVSLAKRVDEGCEVAKNNWLVQTFDWLYPSLKNILDKGCYFWISFKKGILD